MKTGIFLNYKGLGANLLHLSYCHGNVAFNFTLKCQMKKNNRYDVSLKKSLEDEVSVCSNAVRTLLVESREKDVPSAGV